MKTIVYFETESQPALKRVTALRGEMGHEAQCIIASAYVGERIKADKIEFMPDVPDWQRKRIEDAFAAQQERDKVLAKQEAERRAGSPPLKPHDEESFRRSMTSRAADPAAAAKPETKPEHEAQAAEAKQAPKSQKKKGQKG